MRWASAVSQRPELTSAVEEAAEQISNGLGGADPDLVVAFASIDHREGFARLPEQIERLFPGALLLGCSARSVLGAERELEEQTGLALSAATLPGVDVRGFHLSPSGPGEPASVGGDGWLERLGVSRAERPHFLLLVDPFLDDTELLLHQLDEAYPEAVKVGGIASGGTEPSTNALWLGPETHHDGLVGVSLAGAIDAEAIVAQGCRPVGNPMFVTHCRDNVLHEVDGRSPLAVLEELFERAPLEERALFQSSLFLGIEMRAEQTEYHQGDFLIRNLIGGDPEAGSLVVAAPLHTTQVVQFHLRDGRAASEDLHRHLARVGDRERPPLEPAGQGALLFSCLGRGRALYGREGHDTRTFREHLGPIPLTGFFCNGEIGPVQHRTFLHGYTSAFALFRPA